MLEKEKLRKADIFSGGAISLLGLWIISQAVQMPMKDSYGGVMNVWYVSPAIFPLLVGAILVLLGLSLVRIALKEIGRAQCVAVLKWLAGLEFWVHLKTAAAMRLYAMTVVFLSLVYLNVPRIDFFICSVLFLFTFISMFYFDDNRLLKRILRFYLIGSVCFAVYFLLGLPSKLAAIVPHPSDWLAAIFLGATIFYIRKVSREKPELKKKFKICAILSFAAPFSIGPIFKYFLMVPMPYEGLVVMVMDAVWYWDF